MNEKAVKKLKEINELQNQIGDLQRRLEELLDESKVVLPNDFSVINEVLKILEEEKRAIHTKDITKELIKRFPSYGIERKKVAAALVYLKNTKKKITGVGRGVYQVIVSQEQSVG